MFKRSVLGLCGTLAAIACLLAPASCRSQAASQMVQEKIDLSKSPNSEIGERRSAAKSLADDWKGTLPGLVPVNQLILCSGPTATIATLMFQAC